MAQLGPVVVRRTLALAQSEAWAHFIHDELREAWWGDLTLEPEYGGAVAAKLADGEVARGAVDLLLEGRTLGFRWRVGEDGPETSVSFMLRPDDERPDHTSLTVIESGFASQPDAEALVSAADERWTGLLQELAAITGDDQAEEQPAEEETSDVAGADEGVEDAELVEEETTETPGAGEAIGEQPEHGESGSGDPEPDEAEPREDEPSADDEEAVAGTEAETLEESEPSVEEETDAVGDSAESIEEPTADEPDEGAAGFEDDGDVIVLDDLFSASAAENAVELVEAEFIEDDAEPHGTDRSDEVTIVTGSASLSDDDTIDAEEVSEWELLLRGETEED